MTTKTKQQRTTKKRGRSPEPVGWTLTLECGHIKAHRAVKPDLTEEAFCWEWGCLCFRPIMSARLSAD